MTDQIDRADRPEPTARNEPTDSTEPKDTTDPIERVEPIDPIERTEPTDPIERNESFEAIDQRDPRSLVPIAALCPVWRAGAAHPVAGPGTVGHRSSGSRPLVSGSASRRAVAGTIGTKVTAAASRV